MFTISRIPKYESVVPGGTVSVRAAGVDQAAEEMLRKITEEYGNGTVPHRFAMRKVSTTRSGKEYGKWIYILSSTDDGEYVWSYSGLSWKCNDYNFLARARLEKLCSLIGYTSVQAYNYFNQHFANGLHFTPDQKLLFVIDHEITSLKLRKYIFANDNLVRFLGIKNDEKFWIRMCENDECIVGGFENLGEHTFNSRKGLIHTFLEENIENKIMEKEVGDLSEALEELKRMNKNQMELISRLNAEIGDLISRAESAERRENNAKTNLAVERDRADKMETSFMAAEQEIDELRAKLIELTLTSTTAE